MRTNHVFADANIEYENGAVVRTAFVTSYGGNIAETAPDLSNAIDEVQRKLRAEKAKQLPKYEYPSHVLTAAMLSKYAKRGVRLEVKPSECARVSRLDAQRGIGKAIYGGGLLLSDDAAKRHAAAERAAAERAAAERDAALVFELSDRERGMVEMLGGG